MVLRDQIKTGGILLPLAFAKAAAVTSVPCSAEVTCPTCFVFLLATTLVGHEPLSEPFHPYYICDEGEVVFCHQVFNIGEKLAPCLYIKTSASS